MPELQQPDIVGNFLSSYATAQAQQQAQRDRAFQQQRVMRQDEMAQQQFDQTSQLNQLNIHKAKVSALNELLASVPDGDAAAFEAAKQRALQHPELGLKPEDVANVTIADLPRLRMETGQAQQALEMQLKRAQIAAANRSNRPQPGGGLGGVDNKTFDNISSLRKEWQGVNKDFNTVKDAFGRIQATSNVATPAGDISMIYAYMKMLDPGSVVRETEFATAENAKPLLDRLGLSWESVKNAWQGTRLQPAVRQDFLSRANELYQQQYQQYEGNKATYENLSRRFGFDPELVLTDQTGGLRPSATEQPTSFSGSGVFTDISQPVTVNGFTVRKKQ